MSFKNTEIFIFYSYILKAFLMKDWRFFYIICRKWYHYRHFEFLQGTSSSSKSQLLALNHIMSIMCPVFSGKEQFCLLWRDVIKTRGDFQSIQLKKWQESMVLYEKSIVDWIKNLRTQWMFAGEKFYWRINVEDNQQTFT